LNFDSAASTVTSETSPTATNPSENTQLIEELKKPRRVLKTHRKSIDDTKGVSSTDLPPPSLMTTVVDEDDDSITTDSLKEMLNVPQLPLVNIEPEIFQNDGSDSKVVEYDQSNRNKFHEPERLVPPSEHEPSSTLYVKNFVRPLTLQMVRELLQQFAETGRPLELEYLTIERAKELIADAEAKTIPPAGRDTRSNGKNNTTISNVRQTVNHVAPELIFPRTNAKPSLFYKTVAQEDAEARIQIMERRRGKNRT
ncbi:1008_t:CDS:2, partial [Cetraspora pellucida]